jgi:hypothetical protein
MVVQFVDNIIESTMDTTITDWRSAEMYFHDRSVVIGTGIQFPRIGNKINKYGESYTVSFRVNQNSKTPIVALRVSQGRILSVSKGLYTAYQAYKENIHEVYFRTADNIGRQLSLSFEIIYSDENAVNYGTWHLEFGSVTETTPGQYTTDWKTVDLFLEAPSIIRTSEEQDKNSILLPKFVVGPAFGFEASIGEDLRGSIGQTYGYTHRRMRNFSCNFVAKNIDKFMAYFDEVEIHKPHLIVPWDWDCDPVQPMYGTLTSKPIYTKHDRSGWLWDVALTWMEAY